MLQAPAMNYITTTRIRTKLYRRRKVIVTAASTSLAMLVLILLLSESFMETSICYGHHMFGLRFTSSIDDGASHAIPPTYEREAYDILLNSYQRSGSSFTGRLFSQPTDWFYWYEPLWYYLAGGSFYGKDEICSEFHCCKVPLVPSLQERMQSVLEHIYRCNFTPVMSAIVEGMTDVKSESWEPFRQCRRDKKGTNTCTEVMQDVCRRAKHRVTKVLRLSLDNMRNLLDTNPRVKVIHLFRDPRAVINSRITTDWYHLDEVSITKYYSVRTHAKLLCDRMTLDFRAGLDLKRMYPDRFAFIFYEDLMENITANTRDLYAYFGMNPVLAGVALANLKKTINGKRLVNSEDKNYESWWRSQMNMDVIKTVDSVCSEAYKTLGYITIGERGALRDGSVPSYKFRDEFRIKDINRNMLYAYN